MSDPMMYQAMGLLKPSQSTVTCVQDIDEKMSQLKEIADAEVNSTHDRATARRWLGAWKAIRRIYATEYTPTPRKGVPMARVAQLQNKKALEAKRNEENLKSRKGK